MNHRRQRRRRSKSGNYCWNNQWREKLWDDLNNDESFYSAIFQSYQERSVSLIVKCLKKNHSYLMKRLDQAAFIRELKVEFFSILGLKDKVQLREWYGYAAFLIHSLLCLHCSQRMISPEGVKKWVEKTAVVSYRESEPIKTSLDLRTLKGKKIALYLFSEGYITAYDVVREETTMKKSKT